MATGETGFSDVIYDLVSVQYHSLKAGHDYGQYVRDARNGGYEDVAPLFEQGMEEDSPRAGALHPRGAPGAHRINSARTRGASSRSSRARNPTCEMRAPSRSPAVAC